MERGGCPKHGLKICHCTGTTKTRNHTVTGKSDYHRRQIVENIESMDKFLDSVQFELKSTGNIEERMKSISVISGILKMSVKRLREHLTEEGCI